jgi:hypothetical protein
MSKVSYQLHTRTKVAQVDEFRKRLERTELTGMSEDLPRKKALAADRFFIRYNYS